MKDDVKKLREQMKMLAEAVQIMMQMIGDHEKQVKINGEVITEIIDTTKNLADLGKEHAELSVKIMTLMGKLTGKEEEDETAQ